MLAVLTLWLGMFGCANGSTGPIPRDGAVGVDRGLPDGCEAPLTRCDGACVDTRSSGSNCGACGMTCSSGTVCQAGSCATGCRTGMTACGTSCVDTQTDTSHCGECTAPCAAGDVCRSGACDCADGFVRCGGSCIDPNTDPMNCGLCGRACGADSRCNMGSCVCSGAEREMTCDDMMDDDCDGLVDCDDPDCEGTTRPCTSACGASLESCNGDGTWGECAGGTGAAEICGDGIDQDCDGSDLRNPDMYEPNDTCATCVFPASVVDPDITIMAGFDSVADPRDCFAFEVVDNTSFFTGETIDIELTNIPVGHDYDVYLYKSRADCIAGHPLASGVRTSNAPEFVTWTEPIGADDSGIYYVVVSRYRGNSCTAQYSLHFNGLN